MSDVIEARNITISVGANVIGCMRSGGLSLNSNTSKNAPCRGDVNLFSSKSLDDLEWSISVDGGMDPTSTYGYEEIMAAIVAGTAVTLTFDVPGVGNNSFQGDGYGSMTLTAGETGDGTYSAGFEGISDLEILVNV